MSKTQTEMNTIARSQTFKKRRDSTLAEKVKILELLQQPKASQSSVARNMGLSQSTISRVMKKRDEILERWKHNENPSRKRNRPFKHAKVDEALLEWLLFAKANKLPISGPILMRRAEAIAQEIGCPQFKASNGWLWRWKERYRLFYRTEVLPAENKHTDIVQGQGIKRFPDVTQMVTMQLNRVSAKRFDGYPLNRGELVNGERNSAHMHLDQRAESSEGNTQGRCLLAHVAKDYCSDDIFCAVASSFHFRIPRSQGDITEKQKETVSIWFCCNINGTEKLKLLVTHNLPPKSLGTHSISPVSLKTSANGCLTENLFAEWLLSWDGKLSRQERKVLLAFNANSCVPKIKLRNISLCIFSKDNISSNYLFGQDLIDEFNAFYRQLLIERLEEDANLSRETDLPQLISHMTLVEASYTMNKAWVRVTARTIKNCFQKPGGFKNVCLAKHASIDEDASFSTMPHESRNGHTLGQFPASVGTYRKITIKEESDVEQEGFGCETISENPFSPIQKVTVGFLPGETSTDKLFAEYSGDQSGIDVSRSYPKSLNGNRISAVAIKSEDPGHQIHMHELREACSVIHRYLSAEGQDTSIFCALQNQLQRCLSQHREKY
ncbi:tigger transposable element-derived protein 4-like [Pelobates fuscus]|uniref:tigger transposable element-derived protein 4-like n=1 Tax=Pelobates fuscus TaxID=191477 RepID=UPI002FE45677